DLRHLRRLGGNNALPSQQGLNTNEFERIEAHLDGQPVGAPANKGGDNGDAQVLPEHWRSEKVPTHGDFRPVLHLSGVTGNCLSAGNDLANGTGLATGNCVATRCLAPKLLFFLIPNSSDSAPPGGHLCTGWEGSGIGWQVLSIFRQSFQDQRQAIEKVEQMFIVETWCIAGLPKNV